MSVTDDIIGTIGDNKAAIIAGGAGLGLGAAVAITAASVIHKKRKKRSKAKATKSRSRVHKSKKSRYHRRGKYRKTPYTARKRPDTSRRRIRYTKNGQPYIVEYKNINGKRVKRSRFIKKSSARSSQKRRGGRY